MTYGKVYLVGAGPGDPGLITVKGLECIRAADVIVYDRLVHPSLLSHARPDADIIYVGKASSAHTMKQEDINRLLGDKAQEGKSVVRLKGGDPFVFGRGGEEAEHLEERGIPFEVVPGITSAIAVPAYAGIPVTHRGVAASLGIVTGHEKAVSSQQSAVSPENAPSPSEGEGWCRSVDTPGVSGRPRGEGGTYGESTTRPLALEREGRGEGETPRSRIHWDKLATGLDTLVFLMGVENLPFIVGQLVAHGRDPSTPVALVRWGTTPEQETLVGTLENIVAEVERTGFASPAVTVVGDVVNLREKLQWFDNRPLFGKKVLVTRSRDQASALSDLLRQRGADPIEFPVIKVVPPESHAGLDEALRHVETYDWLLFTSANGVRAVVDRLAELGRDVRWLRGPRIGAIGPKTAEAIAALGIRVDFVPTEFVAEAVVREFPEDPSCKRVLIPRAKEAREVLPEKLSEQGAQVDVVTAYETVIESSGVPHVEDLLDAGEIDIITFTSSSTVKNFVQLIGPSIPERILIACIGPITAQTAEELGLKPDIIAEEYTIEGLVKAIVDFGCRIAD